MRDSIRLIRLWIFLSVLVVPVFAQNKSSHKSSIDTIRDYRRQHSIEILRNFADLLSIPNVAQDTPQGHGDINKNAAYIQQLFKARGIETQLLEVPGGFPAIYGEVKTSGATKTVTFYAHYDGQPVSPSKWSSPPFTPVLRKGILEQGAEIVPLESLTSLPADSDEWRLYGRSTSDDKAPVLSFLVALDALKAAHSAPSVNLKFFLEGEEEQGSTHLPQLLEKYADLLRSDLWLICDGPTSQSGQYQLVYGARGAMGLEMTVFGPKRNLHSGHYGNWAPNPAVELVHILSSMRDTEGKITIDSFYSQVRPISPAEEKAIAAMPRVEPALRNELELGRTEGEGRSLMQQIMQPALNIRGIRAGDVGSAATNAIMTQATASIDFRLVPDQKPEQVQQLVEAHLAKLGYFVVHEPPDARLKLAHPKLALIQWDAGYPGARTALDLPEGFAIAKSMESVVGPVLRVPTLGGSVPMYMFAESLKTPVLLVPIANYDNNQHSSNENIKLKNLWNAIELYGALFRYENTGGASH